LPYATLFRSPVRSYFVSSALALARKVREAVMAIALDPRRVLGYRL
jgi:hypothetical protein